MDGPGKISPEGDQAIHISFASHKKIKELRNTWLIEPAVSYKCSQCQQNDIECNLLFLPGLAGFYKFISRLAEFHQSRHDKCRGENSLNDL